MRKGKVMKRCLFVGAMLLSLGIVTDSAAQKRDSNRLMNGDFAVWKEGKPASWGVTVGAGRQDGKRSSIVARKNGGVSLSGDASTETWRSLSQMITVAPGASLRVRFEARQIGVKREGNQYDNCFVGVLCEDAAGKRLALTFGNVTSPELQVDEFSIRVPANTAQTSVVVFLSKTGQLDVRSIEVLESPATDSFDILLADMRRSYSFSQLKQVDWKKLATDYRARAVAAESPAEFIEAIRPMLATLEDTHVWIIDPAGKQIPTHRSKYSANSYYPIISAQLTNRSNIGDAVIIGRTKDRLGYVAVQHLAGKRTDFERAARQIEALFEDCSGIIVDLRKNSGGAEPNAQVMAGLFTDEPVLYAQSVRRNGSDASDFGPPSRRFLKPARQTAFNKPVACLIGPGCVSSGEGLAMMLKALPHVTLFGQATRGASGNPAAVSLPNGVEVFYSRWVSMLPDGTIIEGQGIQPDRPIRHTSGAKQDPTFQAAVRHLLKANESVR